MRPWVGLLVLASACGRIHFAPLGNAGGGSGTGGDSGPPSACALPAPWDRDATYTRTIHVATTGSDSNDGSAGAPLATLNGARPFMTPGTRILLAAGTYPAASLTDVVGTRAQPIAIVGEVGATIDGVDKSVPCIHLNTPSYVIVDGLGLRNCLHGVFADSTTGTTGVIARNLDVRQCSNDGIKLFWVDDFYIENNAVAFVSHVGIYVVGGRNGTIANNQVSDTQFTNIQLYDGSTDILVQGNRLGTAPGRRLYIGGQDTAFLRPPSVYQTERVRVVANVLVGSGDPAIVVSDALDTTIVHNTFVGPQSSLFSIVNENPMPTTGARNVTYEANLIAFTSAQLAIYLEVFGSNETNTVTMRQNLWWADDDPQFAGPTLPAPVVETSPILGIDPLVTADGHVMAGSPAIGRADPAPMMSDLDGMCFESPSTPGADEP